MSGKRIGLLGGSFNPAHEGHLHISREALKRLHLDEIWWLVSPKNPLKKSETLAPYATRLKSARSMASDPRIRVQDFEQEHHLYYTVDTLRWLRRRHPRTTFVWLMGADNLGDFHRWRAWLCIVKLVPIVVLDRSPYAFKGLAGRFAVREKTRRKPAKFASRMAFLSAPAWSYLTIPRHALSATHIRKTLGQKAFVGHNEDKN